VNELGAYLIGQDPSRIEDLWQVLYRGGFYRGGPVLMSALAGIDQALWDIHGKRLGVPVYACLGGRVRDRIPVYSWIGGDDPQAVGEAALAKVHEGFRAVKMNASGAMGYIESMASLKTIEQRIAAVREAVGPAIGIAVDFHGRIHRGMVKQLGPLIEPYGLLFIEEPVLPEHLDALRTIGYLLSTPVATGERLFHRWDFKQILEDRIVDIIQPDLSHAGGISEVRKIATMAEAYDVALAPHCPLGPIALAASLQVDAVCPNAFIQEQSLGIHYNVDNDLLDYLEDPTVFAFSEGACAIPTGPGLGISLNVSRIEAASRRASEWHNPLWRNADGSLAEW